MTATYLAGSRPAAVEEPFGLVLAPEEWTQDALCAQIGGDDWFPEGKGAQYMNAKKVCDMCDVAAQCLEYALRKNEKTGIYAGTTPRQRKDMRKAARR